MAVPKRIGACKDVSCKKVDVFRYSYKSNMRQTEEKGDGNQSPYFKEPRVRTLHISGELPVDLIAYISEHFLQHMTATSQDIVLKLIAVVMGISLQVFQPVKLLSYL